MVPEQEGETQKGHGGIEEGCGKCENFDSAQEFPGERPGFGDFEEEGHCGSR